MLKWPTHLALSKNMKKTRIVKITFPDSSVRYQIQQRHFLFKWWWVPAWVNSCNPWVEDTFRTLEEANKHIYLFEKPHCKIEVVA